MEKHVDFEEDLVLGEGAKLESLIYRHKDLEVLTKVMI